MTQRLINRFSAGNAEQGTAEHGRSLPRAETFSPDVKTRQTLISDSATFLLGFMEYGMLKID